MYMRRLKIRPNVGRSAKPPQQGSQPSTPVAATPVSASLESSADNASMQIPLLDVVKEEDLSQSPTELDDKSKIEPVAAQPQIEIDPCFSPKPEESAVEDVPEKSSEKAINGPEMDQPDAVKESVSSDSSTLEQPESQISLIEADSPSNFDSFISPSFSEFSNVDSCPDDPLPMPASPLKQQTKKKMEKEAVLKSRKLLVKTKDPPERSKMTMVDLIYWNPSDNPMKTPVKNTSSEPKNEVKEIRKEASMKIPDDSDQAEIAPTPRVKIGEDGQIILDEESLVIQHTAPDSYAVLAEDSQTTYFSFRNKMVARRWTSKETSLFYRALTIVGTDFSLMAQLINTRSRHELKLKYKREERSNRKLVEEIIRYSNANRINEFRSELDRLHNSGRPVDEPSEIVPNRKTKKTDGRRRKIQDSNTDSCDGAGSLPRRNLPTLPIDSSDESCLSSSIVLSEYPNDTPSNDIGKELDSQSLSEGQAVKRRRGRPRKVISISDNVKDGSEEGKKQKTRNKAAQGILDGVNVVKHPGGKATTSSNSSSNPEMQVLFVDGESDVNDDQNVVTVLGQSPQDIVLVSETGEMLPFEVVYQQPADSEAAEVFPQLSKPDTTDSNITVAVSGLPTGGDLTISDTTSLAQYNDGDTENAYGEANNTICNVPTRTLSEVDVNASKRKTSAYPNPKRLAKSLRSAFKEKDELENIKEAVFFITNNSESSGNVAETPTDIGAYETVETRKVGRKGLPVSDGPKIHRARFHDFTVSEMDFQESSACNK